MNRIASLAALALAAAIAGAQPLSTAFTFQGRLDSAGAPASGVYDFKFALFDAAAGGAQLGSQLCADNTAVANGTFSVQLDFGSQFAGQQRFLEIWVRPDTGLSCASNSGYTILAPRQNLTAAPNAVFSLNAAAAANATLLNNQPASFYSNAANLTGTLPDARLSNNAALLAGAQTFSGAKSFTIPPSFTSPGGTPPFAVTSTTRVVNLNADLLDGLDSSAFSLTSHTHDASAIVSGLLADARLSTNIPRLNAASTFTTGLTISMTTQTPLNMTSTSTGGTWMNLGNTSANGHTWNAIATATGNSEGAGKLLLRDQTANTVRMTFDTGGNVGIGTTSPAATLDVAGSIRFGFAPGGQWYADSNFVGLFTGNGVSAALALNQSTGNVGIGTVTPGERLEIDAPDATLRVRNTNDAGGGYMQDSFGTLQLGMYNPSASAFGVVPAGGKRALFAASSDGRVGSTTNLNNGNPSFRNLLDDGGGNASVAGNATITGNLAAHNLPAVKATQTLRDARGAGANLLGGNSANIDSLSVNVPGPGFLILSASINLQVGAGFGGGGLDTTNAYFKLLDTSSIPNVQLVEVSKSFSTQGTPGSGQWGSDVLTISWVVPITAGPHSYLTSLYAPDDTLVYWTTTLQAIYVPNGL